MSSSYSLTESSQQNGADNEEKHLSSDKAPVSSDDEERRQKLLPKPTNDNTVHDGSSNQGQSDQDGNLAVQSGQEQPRIEDKEETEQSHLPLPNAQISDDRPLEDDQFSICSTLYETKAVTEEANNECSQPKQLDLLSVVSGKSEWECKKHSNFLFESHFVSSTMHGEGLYTVSNRYPEALYRFDQRGRKWNKLSVSNTQDITSFSIATLNGSLISVGGIMNTGDGNLSCAVRELKIGNNTYEWKLITEMPTGRSYPSVACNNEYLVACGGIDKEGEPLNCVEIFQVESRRWDKVCMLPFTGKWMNAVVDRDYLYVSNAYSDWVSPSSEKAPQVVLASITELLEKGNKPCGSDCGHKDCTKNEDLTKVCWHNISVDQGCNDHKTAASALIPFKFRENVMAISSKVVYLFVSCGKKFVMIDRLEGMSSNAYGASVIVTPDGNTIILIGGMKYSSTECRGNSQPFSRDVIQLVLQDKKPLAEQQKQKHEEYTV